MNLSHTAGLTDCISAKELLDALNTLQQISTEGRESLELSFSQSSHSYFNTDKNQSHMNFELYMEMKNSNKGKKPTKNDKNPCQPPPRNFKKKSTHNITETQKSPTPKQPSQSRNPLKQLKSRSHSPIEHRSIANTTMTPAETKRKSIQNVTPTKKALVSSSVALTGTQVRGFAGNLKKAKDNKENFEAVHEEPTKILDYSKKIMVERERKGKAYIPIQERTSQLIKEKQEKIAKLQRDSLAQKQIEQRECTFKPSINAYKKANPQVNRHRAHTTTDELILEALQLSKSKPKQQDKTQSLTTVRSINESVTTRKSKQRQKVSKGLGGCGIVLNLIN